MNEATEQASIAEAALRLLMPDVDLELRRRGARRRVGVREVRGIRSDPFERKIAERPRQRSTTTSKVSKRFSMRTCGVRSMILTRYWRTLDPTYTPLAAGNAYCCLRRAARLPAGIAAPAIETGEGIGASRGLAMLESEGSGLVSGDRRRGVGQRWWPGPPALGERP